MLEKGIRHCDYCKRPLESGKRTQMKIERIDDRIFQDTLASLDALGITFERQADGSVTVDACTDCNKLFAAQDEQWKADKPKNLAPLRGLTFRHQSYVQKADPEDCCGCGAAFPQDYEGYVTTVGPERWFVEIASKSSGKLSGSRWRHEGAGRPRLLDVGSVALMPSSVGVADAAESCSSRKAISGELIL